MNRRVTFVMRFNRHIAKVLENDEALEIALLLAAFGALAPAQGAAGATGR